MKTYKLFSANLGPEEGAALVFANSVSEAKRLGWWWCRGMFFEEFTDMRVKLIHRPWLHLFKQGDSPHVVDSPPSCANCGWWGTAITEDGTCLSCGSPSRLPPVLAAQIALLYRRAEAMCNHENSYLDLDYMRWTCPDCGYGRIGEYTHEHDSGE